MAKIAVDLDGTVIDYHGPFLAFMNTRFGTSYGLSDLTSHQIERLFGITHGELGHYAAAFFASPTFIDLQPLPGAITGVHALARKHELIILTARSAQMREATAAQVVHHFPDCFREIYHTTNGWEHSANKGFFCQELGIDLLVEDHIDNAREVSTYGVASLLIERPWNIRECLPPNCRRTTWDAIEQDLAMVLRRS